MMAASRPETALNRCHRDRPTLPDFAVAVQPKRRAAEGVAALPAGADAAMIRAPPPLGIASPVTNRVSASSASGFPRAPEPIETLYVRLAWLAWTLFVGTTIALAVWGGSGRTVTPVYHHASTAWWAGVPIYSEGWGGFLYLPLGAVLFAPFAALGPVWGDLLWRALSAALLTGAMARLTWHLAPRYGRVAAPTALLLVALAAGATIGNGQAQVPMIGAILAAAVCVVERRWTGAAAFLVLAVAAKPVAVVAFLLFGALYRPLPLRLLAGLLLAVAATFLHPDPSYVLGQWQGAVGKLAVAAVPTEMQWPDIGGLLHALGLHPGDRALFLVRAAVAPLTLLAAALVLARRTPADGAFLVLGLAMAYLMLFNPRSEPASYVALAAVVAVLAAVTLFERWRPLPAAGLILAALLLGVRFRPDDGIDPWLKPLLALVLAALFLVQGLRAPGPGERADPDRLWWKG